MDGRLSHDRGEAIAFGPGVMVMIAQDDDKAFGMNGSTVLVLFNDEDTHTGDGQTMLFGEAMIFRLFDWIDNIMVHETFVLLSI